MNISRLQLIVQFIVVSLCLSLIMILFSLGDLYLNYDGKVEYQEHKFKRFAAPVSIHGFQFYDMEGNLRTIEEFAGKPSLILFWATWCSYCAKEMPQMDGFVEDYAEELDFSILAIAEPSDTLQKVQRFYTRFSMDSLEAFITSTPFIYKKVRLRGIPSFVVVDSKGNALGVAKPDWKKPESLKLMFEPL